jgi:hypothetical protein
MPLISLTDLVDIASKAGTVKVTKIRQVKHRPSYDPSADFYKRIRDYIEETHKLGHNKNYIDAVITGLTDLKKINSYPVIVDGYKKWWGNKNLVWFDPPNVPYTNFGIDVSVNPELGLVINGQPHLVKLYFKSEPLKKTNTEIITHLMSTCCAQLCPSQPTKMSVLDVRRGKLISPNVPIPTINAMLNAELSYIATLWPSI